MSIAAFNLREQRAERICLHTHSAIDAKPEKLAKRVSLGFALNYSSEIAPTGHPPAQEPQLMQVLGSISNFPSPSLIAPTGHCPAQAPQEIQASPITYAITKTSLNIPMF